MTQDLMDKIKKSKNRTAVKIIKKLNHKKEALTKED